MKTVWRGRDSNPKLRDMNPPCYLCTTPQWLAALTMKASRGADSVEEINNQYVMLYAPTIYGYILKQKSTCVKNNYKGNDAGNGRM